MITAVDTNVLLDLFTADRQHGAASREAIRDALAQGSLVASPVVWAEVATFFEPDPSRARDALDELGVRFEPHTIEAALAAAASWQRYRAAGGAARRVAADFLIGAHALTQADRLLTRDRGFFRDYFPGLTIVDPSAATA